MRVTFLDGRVQTNLLSPTSPWLDVEGPRPALAVAGEYFVLGVEHILLGIDHLLFMLGLVLLVQSALLLVQTITAFTIAHSITLAAATLGFMHMPQAPVEAVRRPHRALSVAGRVQLRAPARVWLRRRLGGGGAAGDRHPARPARVQPGR